MKINFKIDPYNYPIIIIVAFVIGLVLAMALGFRPSSGSHNREHGYVTPALVQSVTAWDVFYQ
ncbi:MAG: hypothetical protein JXB15_06935 [Anaerolineales bacterium]|nr:hypothetical protein [Anaerolineales bacterium]